MKLRGLLRVLSPGCGNCQVVAQFEFGQESILNLHDIGRPGTGFERVRQFRVLARARAHILQFDLDIRMRLLKLIDRLLEIRHPGPERQGDWPATGPVLLPPQAATSPARRQTRTRVAPILAR